jgi:hypothetical protein
VLIVDHLLIRLLELLSDYVFRHSSCWVQCHSVELEQNRISCEPLLSQLKRQFRIPFFDYEHSCCLMCDYVYSLRSSLYSVGGFVSLDWDRANISTAHGRLWLIVELLLCLCIAGYNHGSNTVRLLNRRLRILFEKIRLLVGTTTVITPHLRDVLMCIAKQWLAYYKCVWFSLVDFSSV